MYADVDVGTEEVMFGPKGCFALIQHKLAVAYGCIPTLLFASKKMFKALQVRVCMYLCVYVCI